MYSWFYGSTATGSAAPIILWLQGGPGASGCVPCNRVAHVMVAYISAAAAAGNECSLPLWRSATTRSRQELSTPACDRVAIDNNAYTCWQQKLSTTPAPPLNPPTHPCRIGYGNFGEFGPLDINLKPRNTTWLQAAHLLFVDSPVGAGYSYVDDPATQLPKTNAEIAADLVAFLTSWVASVPEASSTPMYIACESYGGKMGAQAALAILAAVDAGKLQVNLKGVALGDSWVSGIDYVTTWAPFLRSTSILSEYAKTTHVDPLVEKCEDAVFNSNWTSATNYWGAVEGAIGDVTNGVNWYNSEWIFRGDRWAGEEAVMLYVASA